MKVTKMADGSTLLEADTGTRYAVVSPDLNEVATLWVAILFRSSTDQGRDFPFRDEQDALAYGERWVNGEDL